MRTSGAAVLCVAVWGCGGDGSSTGVTSDTGAAGGASSSTASGGSATGGGGGSGASGGHTTSAGGSGAGGGAPASCSGAGPAPGVTQHSLDYDGKSRDYELQIPAVYTHDEPVALVFDLHGFTESKDKQEERSGFSELAEAEGFLVVRPNGYATSWNGGDGCCGSAKSEGLDDVGLMKAIAAEVATVACVDPKRIYATGLSNGAALSHRLGCEAADFFAMIAPVSYPLDFDPFDKCQPARPMPVMHFHGVDDFIVPYNGGLLAASAPDSFAYWAKASGCSGEPAESFQAGQSHCASYSSCAAGAVVTLCTVKGGHFLYDNEDDVPIAELAWAEMQQHPLP